jgi:hypothetical protein
MDSISGIGDLNTVFDNTGGWADEPALSIANDAMGELISIRFPWKWNRFKIPPFPLTPLQQDYATSVNNLGWLENGLRVDINSTQVPPPTWPIYAVRDNPIDSIQGPFPFQVNWFPNDQLEQSQWPGPNKTYVDPIGIKTAGPNNPITNITDEYGNILVLKTYGTTGTTPPKATYPPLDPNSPNGPVDQNADVTGQIIDDGSVQWQVVNPQAQGFRFRPRPPSGGNVWLVRLFAQKKAPMFLKLQQKIDPIPDDQSKWFKDGCIAYAHRYSANPNVKARFEQMKNDWFASMELATKQNDREDESHGSFPDRGVMSPDFCTDPGPYPYRHGWRQG